MDANLPPNLAQMRDEIRRMCGITPPVDMTHQVSDEGKAVVNRPDPSNAVIDNAVRRTLSKLNLACSLHVDLDVTIPVEAAPVGFTGIWYTPIVSMGRGNITDFRHVIWDTGVQPVTYLTPTSIMADDRDGRIGELIGGGTPQHYVIVNDMIGLTPAPQSAGTLRMYTGTAFMMPERDADRIDQLSLDEQVYLLHGAIVEIAMRMAFQAEWQARLTIHQPVWQEGLALIQRQQFLKTRELSPGLKYKKTSHQPNTTRIRS